MNQKSSVFSAIGVAMQRLMRLAWPGFNTRTMSG
jgi:hypothetical protein